MRFYKIAMVVAGIVLAVWGVREARMSGLSKEDPQEITCEDLGRDGPGDNAHVIVTEFVFPTGIFVYEEKRRGGDWEKVWVPVLPLGGEWHQKVLAIYEEHGEENLEDVMVPEPDSFSVIVRSEHVPDEDALDALENQDAFRGLVINEIDSLGREEKKILADEYPGVDLEKCWIVDHKREPKSTGTVILLIGLGAVLAAVGVWLCFPKRDRATQAGGPDAAQ
jgi:hypothetical protein